MKIDQVIFKNFRPFYDEVSIDLEISDQKNIILIGGNNGCGKTTFLLGIFWCLYGSLISTTDNSFKESIRKYQKFLDNTLNKDYKKEGGKEFSVELIISDVEYSKDQMGSSKINIKRSYHIDSQKSVLDVKIDDEDFNNEDFDNDKKQKFINDYLIPQEIARFTFFDTEKISQIADLSSLEQARLMDDTLIDILGLNPYQKLLEKIKDYIQNIQKGSATSEMQEQIINFENKIELNKIKIKIKNKKKQSKENEMKEKQSKIKKLEIEISKEGGSIFNIQELHRKKEDLDREREEFEYRFNQTSDDIPLLILAGLLQEAKEHIDIENQNHILEQSQKNFSHQVTSFIEELFNQGEMPNPDISFQQKVFYAKKSETLADCFGNQQDQQHHSLAFNHELKSSPESLEKNYERIRRQSNNEFEQIIKSFERKKKEVDELNDKIKKAEAESVDELAQSFIREREKLQNERDQLLKEVGGLEAEIEQLEADNKKVNNSYDQLLKEVKIAENHQKGITLAEKYIKVLENFIQEEKEEKTESIKIKLLEELDRLFHKKLIQDVHVSLLPQDKGMKVELKDQDGEKIDSEKLSQGEQQLYISALLKSILDNSIYDLPIFIDTPLARLDKTHRDNILQYYYPNLSTQVVIFSTDTEIDVSKYQSIKSYTFKTYLIENKDGKSSIHEGYFRPR